MYFREKGVYSMAHISTRREAREAVFTLLFETEFQEGRTPQEILALAREDRDLKDDPYVQKTYFGVLQYQRVIDILIDRFSNGWRTNRLSRVSRAVIRLCVYEMMFCEGIPDNVSLNEAIELTKKFDDPKARSFVNGVLNSIKDEIHAKGVATLLSDLSQGVNSDADAAETPTQVEKEVVEEKADEGRSDGPVDL